MADAGGFEFFDHIACLKLYGADADPIALRGRPPLLGHTGRVTEHTPNPTLVERRLMVAMTHRTALEQGVESGAERILILEDRCLLHCRAGDLLIPIVAALAARTWEIVHLGTIPAAPAPTRDRRSAHLLRGACSGWFAVGYARAAAVALLAEMPAAAPRLADWIAGQQSFETVLAGRPGQLLCRPRVASLPHLLPYEDPALRTGFLP